MHLRSWIACLAVLLMGAVKSPTPPGSSANRLCGNYVEVRTASVFAGACHYNSEVMSTGRDALLAWNFSGGQWKGISLAGVRAMACVTSDANLGDASATRRTELVVDTSASDQQAVAVADAIQSNFAASLGHIVLVRRAAISFVHSEKTYKVTAAGFADCSIAAMPNDECCKQPNLVWYTPLVSLVDRKVGFTYTAAYSAGTLGDAWQRADENSAFYGSFAF